MIIIIIITIIRIIVIMIILTTITTITIIVSYAFYPSATICCIFVRSPLRAPELPGQGPWNAGDFPLLAVLAEFSCDHGKSMGNPLK